MLPVLNFESEKERFPKSNLEGVSK